MLVKMVLLNKTWFIHSTTLLKCMSEFMGYITNWFHLHGFLSTSVSRNTFGIEKAYCYELRNCTSSSDMATYVVS